jgi:hypothetical protein
MSRGKPVPIGPEKKAVVHTHKALTGTQTNERKPFQGDMVEVDTKPQAKTPSGRRATNPKSEMVVPVKEGKNDLPSQAVVVKQQTSLRSAPVFNWDDVEHIKQNHQDIRNYETLIVGLSRKFGEATGGLNTQVTQILALQKQQTEQLETQNKLIEEQAKQLEAQKIEIALLKQKQTESDKITNEQGKTINKLQEDVVKSDKRLDSMIARFANPKSLFFFSPNEIFNSLAKERSGSPEAPANTEADIKRVSQNKKWTEKIPKNGEGKVNKQPTLEPQ